MGAGARQRGDRVIRESLTVDRISTENRLLLLRELVESGRTLLSRGVTCGPYQKAVGPPVFAVIGEGRFTESATVWGAVLAFERVADINNVTVLED